MPLLFQLNSWPTYSWSFVNLVLIGDQLTWLSLVDYYESDMFDGIVQVEVEVEDL